jgi:hypothetical protein
VSTYTTKAFWAATGERAVRTFAQAILGYYTAGIVAVNFADLGDTWADFRNALAIGVGASLYAILFSVATVTITSDSSPGFTEIPKATVETKVDTAVNSALEDETQRQARLAANQKEI